MPLKLPVLAAQITNLSDARYFAAFPVDWLCFTCNPVASSYLPVEKIQEIISWVSGPELVLDIRGCTAHQISELLEQLLAQALLIDSFQNLSAEIHEHYSTFRQVIVPPVYDEELLLAQEQIADYYLLDFETNAVDASKVFNSDFLSMFQEFPIYVQANFSVNQVSQLKGIGVKGLVVLGGEEEKVGIRSFEDVQDLMEELEEWE